MKRKHAVIMGGSMAGLLTARVLSESFEQVTVIERDKLPSQPEFRSGVPQVRHPHLMLKKGQELLAEWFSGIDKELAEAGAPLIDWGHDAKIVSPYHTILPHFDSRLITRTSTRPLWDHLILTRLRNVKNIRFLEQHKVVTYCNENSVVTGVQVKPSSIEETQTIYCDLLVDATGRRSKTPEWLKENGFDAPQQTTVDAKLGYATGLFRLDEKHRPWQALMIAPSPPDVPYGGGIYPIENGLWQVLLAGIAGNYPPTDVDGFFEFARHIPIPDFSEAIKEGELVSSIYGYRRTQNRWIHYEKYQQWPDGLIVLGDAFSAFNPVYGQGMTASALGAKLLETQLKTKPISKGFARRFHKQLAKQVIKPVWLLATSEDYRWVSDQKIPIHVRLGHRFLERFLRTHEDNPEAAEVFFEITNMIRSPLGLLAPRFIWPMLKGTR